MLLLLALSSQQQVTLEALGRIDIMRVLSGRELKKVALMLQAAACMQCQDGWNRCKQCSSTRAHMLLQFFTPVRKTDTVTADHWQERRQCMLHARPTTAQGSSIKRSALDVLSTGSRSFHVTCKGPGAQALHHITARSRAGAPPGSRAAWPGCRPPAGARRGRAGG